MISIFAAFALTTAAAADAPRDAWGEVLSERRAANIERLIDYAEAGRFPLNVTQPGPAHLFMDDTGSRCGMAELIWRSGHEELVVDVYQSRNDVVMADLSDDPLADWVAISGLTMEEVAFIQEPGFMVEQIFELPVREFPSLQALEAQRRMAHFAMAAAQLEMMNETSLELAVERLGPRALSAPEMEPWSSVRTHSTTSLAPATAAGQPAPSITPRT